MVEVVVAGSVRGWAWKAARGCSVSCVSPWEVRPNGKYINAFTYIRLGDKTGLRAEPADEREAIDNAVVEVRWAKMQAAAEMLIQICSRLGTNFFMTLQYMSALLDADILGWIGRDDVVWTLTI